MESDVKNQLDLLQTEVKLLKEKIAAIEGSRKEQLSLAIVSGEMDKIIAAMVLALAAAGSDLQVKMFFSFWSLSALRDPKKSAKGKDFISKMFGFMLPRGINNLKLSHFHMFGMGATMIKSLMKKNRVYSLNEMLKLAGELEIEITICEMSMGLMGFKKEELIDYPHLRIAGAATFINEANESSIQLFI